MHYGSLIAPMLKTRQPDSYGVMLSLSDQAGERCRRHNNFDFAVASFGLGKPRYMSASFQSPLRRSLSLKLRHPTFVCRQG